MGCIYFVVDSTNMLLLLFVVCCCLWLLLLLFVVVVVFCFVCVSVCLCVCVRACVCVCVCVSDEVDKTCIVFHCEFSVNRGTASPIRVIVITVFRLRGAYPESRNWKSVRPGR